LRKAIVVVALVLAALTSSGCGRDVPASLQVGVTTIDAVDREPMPELSGSALDGSSVDLSTMRGKVVVLNSWASWCAPCKEEIPSFVKLSEASDPAEVVVVGLNVSDDSTAAKAFVGQYGMGYPNIVDSSAGLLAKIPGVPPKSLPSTVVIDRQGRIAARVIGAADSDELGRIVASVSAETPVS
jgi:thiol-disulfide isomerase/thioredoxin